MNTESMQMPDHVRQRLQAKVREVFGLPLLTITTEDRLRGAIVEAMGELEQGHHSAAWQVLRDALKIKGEIR